MINESLKFTNCAPSKIKKKKKTTEPCSVEKGLNTFARSVNLHLPAGALDLMDPKLVDIVFGIINHEDAITSLFLDHGSCDFACGYKIFNHYQKTKF